MPAAKIRTFMIDRFRQLSKKSSVIAVERNEEAGTWDVQFANNCWLRVTDDEYESIKSKIVIADPPAGGGG